MYYADKIDTLKDLFGAERVELRADEVKIDDCRYPVIDDVIVLLDPSQYTQRVSLRSAEAKAGDGLPTEGFAPDIQRTFGSEWGQYDEILPEHEQIFNAYFDCVDVTALKDKRVCDLGCGAGRWSFHMSARCRELVLVDFSDAIFTARKNLRSRTNAVFFMADIRRLPFRDDFADFIFSLGVLHHLPTPCLDEVRALRRLAPHLLIYLYYALDNRPEHFRSMLRAATFIRERLSKMHSPGFRKAIAVAGAAGVYKPLIWLGSALRPFNLQESVPLYAYHDKSFRQIEQDVYDRFFTRIEQRVSREEIVRLRDTYGTVSVADTLPYWHFVCRR